LRCVAGDLLCERLRLGLADRPRQGGQGKAGPPRPGPGIYILRTRGPGAVPSSKPQETDGTGAHRLVYLGARCICPSPARYLSLGVRVPLVRELPALQRASAPPRAGRLSRPPSPSSLPLFFFPSSIPLPLQRVLPAAPLLFFACSLVRPRSASATVARHASSST
jgi:hypothetical protein